MDSRPERHEEKLAPNTLFWSADFDLTNRVLYVYFKHGKVDDRVPSDDGNYVADISYIGDLPIVLGLEFKDPNWFSIFQDQIEEAVETCMNTLNVCKGDDFAADCFKGVMVYVEDEDG